jgi:hypothetical protein
VTPPAALAVEGAPPRARRRSPWARLGVAGFLFFLVKGLLWLIVPALLWIRT